MNARSAAARRWLSLPAIRLILVSILSLYFELMFIRWIPTQVRLLAYFTNFVLIAALLGLGLGMLLGVRTTHLTRVFPVGVLMLTLLVVTLERHNLVLPIVSTGEVFWNYIDQLPLVGILSYLALVGFFLLLVGVFACLGQEVGRQLRSCTPLVAYSLNIGGSLLGVLSFALVNQIEAPPEVWFAGGVAGFILYQLLAGYRRRWIAVGALSFLASMAVLHVDLAAQPRGVSTYWSPYYKITVQPEIVNGRHVGFMLGVNSDNFQHAFDLSGQFRGIAFMAARERQYDLPFTFNHPKHVLILGSGMGNDVAAAVRMTRTATIDAVEIDPVIAQLGRKLHPEHPYSNPRVRLHVTDARSFLQQTSQKYDLILFGKLDSHRVFSHMSSVRMDNYIYTRENLDTVRKHLAPGGIVAIGFVVHEKWIAERLFTLLDRAFGRAPLVYQTSRYAYDTLFFEGAGSIAVPTGAPVISHAQFVHAVLAGDPQDTWHYSSIEGFISPSEFSTGSTLLTDDWPYLYMQDRTIPANYLLVLVLTVAVSVLLVWLTVPRIDFRTAANWNFLLLGAGFALQETKGVTDVALLFGSTWITNIIVISSVLLVILLATFTVSRWPDIPLHWMYLALVAALLANYALPLRGLLEYGFWFQVLASGVRVAGPMFFSGIIFARWFAHTTSAGAALGANLMGAVLGGLVEYSSLALGSRNLYLLAVLCYALSFSLGASGSLRRRGLWGSVAPGGAQ